ncbi:MAG TPA: hypothetical protein VFB58_03500 [Chloroflexota bacterium]|nr:hypothetical protein [Chloroflexota bacterium]
MRGTRFALVLAVAAVLAGCGSAPYTTYTDKAYHFSLQYPTGWTQKTDRSIADSVPSYIVSFTGSSAQLRVVVNDRRPDYSTIFNGEVTHQGPNTLVFYRLTMAGHHAILVLQKTNGLPPDHEYVHLNTARHGYDIEMIVPTGIVKSYQQKFQHALDTFKLGEK